MWQAGRRVVWRRVGITMPDHPPTPHTRLVCQYPERAVLCQTTGNLAELQRHYPDITSFNEESSFGENVLLEAPSSSGLCVGDEFRVVSADGTARSTTLQVSSQERVLSAVCIIACCVAQAAGVGWRSWTRWRSRVLPRCS